MDFTRASRTQHLIEAYLSHLGIFCLIHNSLWFQYKKNTLESNTPKFNLRTTHNFVKHMHNNSVTFIFSGVSGSSNRKRDFSVSPHVIFCAYEIIQ